MIFQIEITGDQLEELEDIVEKINIEQPSTNMTLQKYVENQVLLPLDERIDQQYVASVKKMDRATRRQKLGKLKDIKNGLKLPNR